MKKHSQPSVASTYIVESISLFKKMNLDLEPILDRIDIDPIDLEDPTSHFTLSQFRRILKIARSKIGDLPLGILLGLRLGITSHGFAGLAAVTQKNVGECIKSIETLFELRMPAFSAKFIQSTDYFGLRFSEIIPLNKDLPFFIETIYSSFSYIGNLQSGENYSIHKLRFSYPEPKNSKLYYEVFGNNIEFEATHNEYLVPINRYNDPTIMSDPRNSKYYKQKLCDETPDANKNSLAKNIMRIFEEEDDIIISPSDMAAKLNLSERSLRRKLNNANTSYLKLLGLYRRNKAIFYLRFTEYSITEIALILGYSDSSHFCKAFKSWSSCTPREYRSRSKTA